MSYCRFSEGDVYLIMHVYGGWVCYSCNLNPGESVKGYKNQEYKHRRSWNGGTLRQVRDHIQQHIDAGHEVPARAMETVLEEIERLGEEFDNPYERIERRK